MTIEVSSKDEGSAHIRWLRQAADEIRSEGHVGWGNTCEQAADAFAALERENAVQKLQLDAYQLRFNNITEAWRSGSNDQILDAVRKHVTAKDCEVADKIALGEFVARQSHEPRERLPVRIELKGDKEVCWGQSRGQHCVFITQLDHVGKQGETVPDAEREKVKDVADFALIVDSEERAKEIADCLCGRRPQFETNGERP